MAIDFGILERAPTIASRFMAGQEAARAEQERNMLLQQRQMQFEQEQENRLRAQQQDAQFEQMANLIREHGADPDDPQVLGKFAQAAFLSKQPQLASFVATMMERAAKRREPEKPVVVGGRLVRPSTGEVVYAGPEAAPKPLVIGNRLVSPAGEVIYEPPEAPPRPIALGNRLVSPAGEVIYEPPEAPPRPIALGNRLVTPTGEVVYEAPLSPAPAGRPVAVGGRLISPEGKVLYEPPPGPIAPHERFVPVGPHVFDRVEGKFIEGPGRPAVTPPPEARAKPVAPIRMRPNEVLVSPETGEPIYTAPSAAPRTTAAPSVRASTPARAPTGYRFKPDGTLEPIPGGPVERRDVTATTGTPAQRAKTEAQQAAQTKLSQDIRTQLGYYEKLAEMGGMTSPSRSVAENVAAFARSSGIGQQAERAIATEAQTLRDNIKNTRQRLFLQMKDATGATASQMNSNAEMQAWLNSMTDPQQSIETVRETLKQLDYVIAGMRDQVAREAAAKGGAGAAPAAAPAPAPAPARAPAAAAPRRREIAPGVFVTERP